MELLQQYSEFKENAISGRYITNNHIKPLLDKLSTDFKVTIESYSVEDLPIYSVRFGTGKTKIYMWSQMHGNESTTTKALFDFFNYLQSDEKLSIQIKENFTLLIVPIANPDGAQAYTRVNANEVDLNRNSVELSEPESVLLRKLFDEFQPDYCYNLHDQRTIFAAGDTSNPATVSFLAPSYNETCEYNEVRLNAVDVIVAMNLVLQKYIPNQVGRFDDAFNINCIGDQFTSLKVPTILFEAGHFQEDYQREETRKYIFIALLSSFEFLLSKQKISDSLIKYLNIPQNKANFADIVCRNFKIKLDSLNFITNFAIQFKEVLVNNSIFFEAYIVGVSEKLYTIGHKEFNGEGFEYQDESNNVPVVGNKANFKLVTPQKTIHFVNGMIS